MTPSNRGEARAWAWVDHLRNGGTSPWSSFIEEGESRGESWGESRGPLLPDAIQLELVRRLNLLAGGPQPELADRVLESSAPGRGQPDLPVAGALEWSGFGPTPIDPADAKPLELLRLAVGVIADLTVDSDPGQVEDAKPRHRLPWRRAGLFQRGWHIVGNPLTGYQTREALARAGSHPGRRDPVAVVLADDLGVMFADLWAWRVRRTLCTTFPSWVGKWARRDELPQPLDTVAVAARWARQVGADHVHVVVQRHPAAEVARIVGSRRPLDGTHTGLSGAASQLVRDVNGVLRVLVDPDRHQHLLDHVLLPWLADEHGPRWAVPDRHEEWVRRRAERLRDELGASRYSLHGDLDLLVSRPGVSRPIVSGPGVSGPAERASAMAPSDEAVLEVALRTLLGSAQTSQEMEEVR